MAKLQSVMLAEYGRVDAGGLLTIVGAGFDRVLTPVLPAHQNVGVCMLFDLAVDEASLEWTIQWRPPTGPVLRLEGSGEPLPSAQPVDGRLLVPVAINVTLPLLVAGIYRVIISVAEEVEAERIFEVQVHPRDDQPEV